MGGNEKEKVSPPAIDSSVSNACGLEGVETRPQDCPNNPWRHPENHRPAVCAQCPGDPNIWQVAKDLLPLVHIRTKQGGEIILPKPNSS